MMDWVVGRKVIDLEFAKLLAHPLELASQGQKLAPYEALIANFRQDITL